MRILGILFAASCLGQTVSIAHNDLAQTGSIIDTQLTVSNVAAGKFAKRGVYATDGSVYAQPLYIPRITVSGTVYDLIITADLSNYVYAFDANRPGTSFLWRSSQLGTPSTTVSADGTYNAAIGILSTPYVDVSGSLVYVTTFDSTNVYKLHKLSLTTGVESASVTISGTVSGVAFPPTVERQRTALTAANGNIYIGFAACCNEDVHNWYGFLFAYRMSDLAQVGAFVAASATGFGAGIWQSSAAPAIDASGNVYVTTGNGTWDGVTDFSETTLKLTGGLSLTDWFTPSNHVTLDTLDADVSASRVILLPGTSLAAVVAAKDFKVYLIDTGCMGHLQGSSGCTLQTFDTDSMGVTTRTSGSYGGVFMNNVLYLPTTAGSLYAFSFGGSTFNTTPVATNLTTHAFPGPAGMSGSWNGVSGGIIWATTVQSSAFTSPAAAILRAVKASDLTEIWNSGTSGTDTLGNLSKFIAPTIANGRVYVPTLSGITVYGLIASAGLRNQGALTGQAVLR